MNNIVQNILVLVACWLLVTGAGVYVTFFKQPGELERLQKAEKVAKLKKAEVASLLAEESATRQRAEEVVRRWRARYKIIPARLEDYEVVGYLNELSKSGFKNFDIVFNGVQKTRDFSTYSYMVTGRGYFTDLYRVVWELENNRNFYRVRDLKLSHIDLVTRNRDTEREELKVMVSFTMSVEAYFGGAKGLSAEQVMAGVEDGNGLPTGYTNSLPPVPSKVLPDQKPASNPFYPIIMERIPPNSDHLVDLEEAELVSLVGGKAIFKWENDYYTLGVGDRVYLGQITLIDPTEDRVLARLNKGGIIDEVELHLQTGERFRQALGPNNLSPVQQ